MLIASLGDWATSLAGELGYLGLFVVMVGENLFPPIPSEAILPLAGFQVSKGALTFTGALAVTTAGSLAGAIVLYSLGRFGGRPAVLRLGPWLRVSPEQLERGDHWFDRYGPWMVLFGRLVPGARSVVSVPAGMSEMPLLHFASLTLVGSLGWNAVLIGVGQSLGANWPAVSALIDSVSTLVLVVLALGSAALVVRWARRAPVRGSIEQRTERSR